VTWGRWVRLSEGIDGKIGSEAGAGGAGFPRLWVGLLGIQHNGI
jgi:hypothetical protein